MSVNFNNNLSFSSYPQNNVDDDNNAPKIIKKPIKKVENVINNTVDKFVKEPEDKEKKKSHKKAITVGSTVLVLSALGALLNPKFSGKFVNKLKTISKKAEANVQKNKDNYLKSKFHSVIKKITNFMGDLAQFSNTINATKDIGFKWLCSAEKFDGVKNNTAKKTLKKCNSGFTNVMTKINNNITNWFDNIGKKTVFMQYKSANKDIDSFNTVINIYKKKLKPAEQKLLDEKLNQIATTRKFFSESEITSRLNNQEKIMDSLENDFKDKLFNGYFKKFKGRKSSGSFADKTKYNLKLVRENMSYWAEDILMPKRNVIEETGNKAIDVLVGDGKNAKGTYQEIVDILSPYLKKEEKTLLEKELKNTTKALRKANHSECVEYFDKKRDLVLGGAPTDILTNATLLGISGVAISRADDKQERISKALTKGFPAVAGIGTSIAMTGMLFSGVQGMIIGALTGTVLSILGSAADKHFNPKKPQTPTIDSIPNEQQLNSKKLPQEQEKQYA